MMKQKAIYQRFLLLAALPAFMLASCSQEETTGGQDAQSGEIRFEIGFAPQTEAVQRDAQTRVTTDTNFRSTWEEGDEIGLFAVEHDTELAAAGNYIHNVKLTYMGGGTWTVAEDLYWPAGSTKLDFYAYYPYADDVDPTLMEFNVDTDQSASTGGKNNYNLSEMLMAKNDNLGKGYGKGETVKLSLTHALAMVQVNVSSSMIGDYPADMLKVWLNGCTTDGVLNLSTQSTTPPTNAASAKMIKMYPCPNDGDAPGIYAYRALVPAQEIAAGTAMFRFEYDGGTLLRSVPLAEPLSLVAGTAEKFDMTFPFTSATADVSSNVRLDELFLEEELAEITHLKVMGEMTQADFYTIRDMMPTITSLDLGRATVVGNVNTSEGNIVQGNAIPMYALRDKKSLQKFIFPSGITSVGDGAFFNCNGLTGTLTLPASLTTINMGAFYNCSGLTGPLTIPEGVTTIGRNAFQYCIGFTALTLPASLTAIEDQTFRNCSGLTGPLNIPAGVQTIGANAFNGCSGITSLNISEGVQTIGSNAFEKCSKLSTLTIPTSVIAIQSQAFDSCTSLSSITCYITELDKFGYATDGYGGDITFFNVPIENVTVYVPEAAVEAYQRHRLWGIFEIKPIPTP